MKVAITGATGYIGSHLTSIALKRGHNVSALSRKKPATPGLSWIPFEFSSASSVLLPAGTDAVIHLAANTAYRNDSEAAQEIIAARALVETAQNMGAKFIFVSSQTARPDAPTTYGLTKWRIEQEVLSAGGWVVRPGQVYGGELRGLFGMLAKLVYRLPLLPAFVPAPKVQPIHVDDLAEGLLRITERCDIPAGVHSLAATEAISFSEFLDEIAKTRLRCWRGFMPVPVVAINALGTVLGESLRTRLGLERVRSLFDLPVMETASDLNQLGLVLRPLRSGMHRSGDDRRRCLLQEGRTLLTYVLKGPPSGAVLRRYIRAIELLRGGKVLGLPQIYRVYPILLSLTDEPALAKKTSMAEFSWRLDAATVLAEATPSGAYRFLGLGRERGVMGSLLSVTGAVTSEVFWRGARAICSPLVRLAQNRARRCL
jgi:NADH dehydrogenase